MWCAAGIWGHNHTLGSFTPKTRSKTQHLDTRLWFHTRQKMQKVAFCILNDNIIFYGDIHSKKAKMYILTCCVLKHWKSFSHATRGFSRLVFGVKIPSVQFLVFTLLKRRIMGGKFGCRFATRLINSLCAFDVDTGKVHECTRSDFQSHPFFAAKQLWVEQTTLFASGPKKKRQNRACDSDFFVSKDWSFLFGAKKQGHRSTSLSFFDKMKTKKVQPVVLVQDKWDFLFLHEKSIGVLYLEDDAQLDRKC